MRGFAESLISSRPAASAKISPDDAVQFFLIEMKVGNEELRRQNRPVWGFQNTLLILHSSVRNMPIPPLPLRDAALIAAIRAAEIRVGRSVASGRNLLRPGRSSRRFRVTVTQYTALPQPGSVLYTGLGQP
jgi:hypothetical protein